MDEFLVDLTTTICAISTPHGAGGIAVIRVSGPDALEIVGKVWQGCDLSNIPSHSARLGQIIDDRSEEPLDQCIATVFKGPHSYTGQDTVELSVHGSKWIQREVISLLIRHGAQLAGRGEFTRRALANGHLDLAQAEGVADLIASESRAAHRIAIRQMKGSVTQALETLRRQLIHLASLIELELDFSEEDVEFVNRSKLSELTSEIITEVDRLHKSYARGNAIKEGIPVAIVGPTNAGKSSLLNRLLNDNRAIVSDIHGTTRDTIEETMELGNYLFRFIDTAGLRDTSDPIEQIGISRSRKAIDQSSVIIVLIDATLVPGQPEDAITYIRQQIDTIMPDHDNTNDYSDRHILIALNKIDLLNHTPSYPTSLETSWPDESRQNTIIIPISTLTGQGISALIEQLEETAATTDSDQILITSQRQAQALAAASSSLHILLDSLSTSLPTDLLAFHLRDALHHLSSVTDPITTPDILNSIFQSFCIGK